MQEEPQLSPSSILPQTQGKAGACPQPQRQTSENPQQSAREQPWLPKSCCQGNALISPSRPQGAGHVPSQRCWRRPRGEPRISRGGPGAPQSPPLRGCLLHGWQPQTQADPDAFIPLPGRIQHYIHLGSKPQPLCSRATGSFPPSSHLFGDCGATLGAAPRLRVPREGTGFGELGHPARHRAHRCFLSWEER